MQRAFNSPLSFLLCQFEGRKDMTNEKMKKRIMELLLVLAGNVLMSIGVGAFVIPEELMSG